MDENLHDESFNNEQEVKEFTNILKENQFPKEFPTLNQEELASMPADQREKVLMDAYQKAAKVYEEGKQIYDKTFELWGKYKDRFKKGSAKIEKKLDEKTVEITELVKNHVSSHLQRETFFNGTKDAQEFRPEIEKVAEDRGLSVEDAYKLVMFDKINDSGYQAKQRAGATEIHGKHISSKEQTWPYRDLFAKRPKFLQALNKDKD